MQRIQDSRNLAVTSRTWPLALDSHSCTSSISSPSSSSTSTPASFRYVNKPLPSTFHDVSRSKSFSEDESGRSFGPHLNYTSCIQLAQNSSGATRPDLGDRPPPRPARSPKRERLATGRTCTSIQPWPLPPYCYDPFVGYADSSSSKDTEIDCSREDSIDLDPFLCSELDLKQMLDTPGGQFHSAPASSSKLEVKMPKSGFDGDKKSSRGHADERWDKMDAFLSPTLTRKVTFVDDSPSRRLSKRSSFLAGRGIIDIDINTISRKAGSVQSFESCDHLVTIRQKSHPATLDDKDTLDEVFVPGSDSGAPPRLTFSSKELKSASATTEVHLGLLKHSRGLRKQIYPPRVRYSMLTVSSSGCARSGSPRVVSTSGPLLRCAMDEKYPFDSPRSASDFRRPSL